MSLDKDRLIFDTADEATSDSVGAYVRSSDGTLIDHVTIAAVDRLAVDATMKAGDGTDLTQTGGALDVNITNSSDIEVAVNSEYAEDSAHGSGDIGSFALAVRQDTLAASTDADGDYSAFKVDSLGRLYTNSAVQGDVADDAADSGNPLKVGSRAVDGALTAISASDDRADLLSDLYRRTGRRPADNPGRHGEIRPFCSQGSQPAAGRYLQTAKIASEGRPETHHGDACGLQRAQYRAAPLWLCAP